MCTLTIIPLRANDAGKSDDRAVRVVCNRDESRLRPTALPPQLRQFGPHRAYLPIDPVSDGTWIAASDAALVCVLMNVYVQQSKSGVHLIETGPSAGTLSRGRIIPQILVANDLGEACQIAASLDHSVFEPYRLIIADRRELFELIWSERHVHVTKPKQIERPVFLTSSGLGDDLVATPRRKLFEELFDNADWPAAQDAFHRHAWPDKRGSSVWMTRPEAMTVSITEIELLPQRVTMSYRARVNDGAATTDFGPFSLISGT